MCGRVSPPKVQPSPAPSLSSRRGGLGQQLTREHPRRLVAVALLAPRLLMLPCFSLGSLYTLLSSSQHPHCLFELESLTIISTAIAAPRVLGEGGTPERLLLHFLLHWLPLCSVKCNPQLIWAYHRRVELIVGFPIFGRNHCASSPRPVSVPFPNSILWQHQWDMWSPF